MTQKHVMAADPHPKMVHVRVKVIRQVETYPLGGQGWLIGNTKRGGENRLSQNSSTA